MNINDIRSQRLSSHGFWSQEFSSSRELITHYWAIQAQDYQWACWMIGSRVAWSTLADVENAISYKDIVRLWPMRGTLHMVNPSLAHSFIDLCASRTLSSFPKRRAYLGISDTEIEKALAVIESSLRWWKSLTRMELEEALLSSGLKKKKQWIYHITCYAATRKLICFWPRQWKDDTFVLFDEWIWPNILNSDEGIAAIARSYIRSHGPATINDLAWWTWWNKWQSKNALWLIAKEIDAIDIDWTIYYFAPTNIWNTQETVLLAGFDEYFLGYKDRTLVAKNDDMSHYMTKNGIFSPLVVQNGEIIGKRKRTFKTTNIKIEYTHINKDLPPQKDHIEKLAQDFTRFYGLSDYSLIFH